MMMEHECTVGLICLENVPKPNQSHGGETQKDDTDVGQPFWKAG